MTRCVWLHFKSTISYGSKNNILQLRLHPYSYTLSFGHIQPLSFDFFFSCDPCLYPIDNTIYQFLYIVTSVSCVQTYSYSGCSHRNCWPCDCFCKQWLWKGGQMCSKGMWMRREERNDGCRGRKGWIGRTICGILMIIRA